MTFAQSAREFALLKATEIEAKARQIGIMRSVDATESAAWLDEIASAMRVAAGSDEEPPARFPAARIDRRLVRIPEAHRAYLVELRAELGLAAAAKRLHLGRTAFLGVLALGEAMPGTAAIIREGVPSTVRGNVE